MRKLRRIKNVKFKKRRNSQKRIVLVVLSIMLAFVAIFIVSKIKKKLSPSELTPGKIYTKESQQKKQDVPDLTFYRVLSSKEGEITPLSVDTSKEASNEEKDKKILQSEKTSHIDDEIVKHIGKKDEGDFLYTVQVGAHGKESSANELLNRLKSQGFVPYIIKRDESGKGTLYKVSVGRFQSIVDAQEVAKVLKKEGYETYVIKTEN